MVSGRDLSVCASRNYVAELMQEVMLLTTFKPLPGGGAAGPSPAKSIEDGRRRLFVYQGAAAGSAEPLEPGLLVRAIGLRSRPN